MAILGELAVVILPAAIPPLISFLHSWMTRGRDRRVKIKTSIGGRTTELEYSPGMTSQDELKQLLDTLMASQE